MPPGEVVPFYEHWRPTRREQMSREHFEAALRYGWPLPKGARSATVIILPVTNYRSLEREVKRRARRRDSQARI